MHNFFFKILQGSSLHFIFGAILPTLNFKIHVHFPIQFSQRTYRTNQIKYYDDPVRQEGYDGHIYIYKLTERTVVLLNAIFEDVLPQTEILLPPWVKPE